MRVDATLRFDLEDHLEDNEGKTMFSFGINSYQTDITSIPRE